MIKSRGYEPSPNPTSSIDSSYAMSAFEKPLNIRSIKNVDYVFISRLKSLKKLQLHLSVDCLNRSSTNSTLVPHGKNSRAEQDIP